VQFVVHPAFALVGEERWAEYTSGTLGRSPGWWGVPRVAQGVSTLGLLLGSAGGARIASSGLAVLALKDRHLCLLRYT
jgi:hypothetical protein